MSTNYDMEPLPPTEPMWGVIALVLLAACVLSLSYCHV